MDTSIGGLLVDNDVVDMGNELKVVEVYIAYENIVEGDLQKYLLSNIGEISRDLSSLVLILENKCYDNKDLLCIGKTFKVIKSRLKWDS